MAVEAVYEGGLRCRVECGPARTEMHTDVPAVYGGRGELPGPMDLLEAAVGTCILGVVGLVANRYGVDVAGTRASVCREMDAAGRRIARVAVSIAVPAAPPKDVQDAIEAAAASCPVRSALLPDLAAPITFQWGAE